MLTAEIIIFWSADTHTLPLAGAWHGNVCPSGPCVFFSCILQLEDLAKLSIKGEVVQAAKIPTSNAYRRGDSPGTRSRWVHYLCDIYSMMEWSACVQPPKRLPR